MFTEERKFESVMKRIGGAMLIFVAAFNLLCGGAESLRHFFADILFPGVAIVYVITEILCSLAYCASFILPVLFFYLISNKKPVEPMDLELRLPDKYSIFKILSVLFIGISIILTMAYLNAVLLPTAAEANDAIFDMDLTSPYKIVLLFFSTAVVPAFVEELMFRGMIYSNLRPYGRGVAIVISAVLFGLMHQNAGQLLYATAAGVVLAVVYEMTRSFWCCVLLHFFNNFFSIIEQVLFQQYSVEKASLLCTIAEVSIFFIGVIFAALWIIVGRRESRVGRDEERTFFGKMETAQAVICKMNGKAILRGFWNPVMIVFILVAFGQMMLVYFLY